MLMTFVPHVLVLLVFSPILLPLLFYLQDRHDLRRFPSPTYAAWSSLWRIWHNLMNKHYLAVHKAHERYGTHVRIAPNHVSILDSRAPYEIYGHGANMLKEGWYDAAAGAHRNLADVRNKFEHQRKRKMLAHAFAPKTVTDLEPLLRETVDELRRQLDWYAASSKAVDMRRYVNFFTIDLFGKILYGAKLECLQRGDDMLTAEAPDGETYNVPFIDSLLNGTAINTALAFDPWLLPLYNPLVKYHPYKRAGADWENIVRHNTRARMAKTPDDADLFSKLLNDSKGQALRLEFGEVMAECSAMMNAGTETTTAALTNTIYLLYLHPKILGKLRDEIDAAVPLPEIPSYNMVSQLPYLRACIEESLRIRPPSSFGLPRVVPAGGRTIAGQFVAEGVTVSVPTYSLLRDKHVFENPDQYDPDRWLNCNAESKHTMMNNHLPFSTGPRACIGRNIAYFEQIVLIATLVKFYDFEIASGFELETIERFNSNPGQFPVRCKLRLVP